MTDSLYITSHAKLLASDFHSLSPKNPSSSSSFLLHHGGACVSTAETLGIVVTRESKPGKFLRFTIDDGTGLIPCVLWLNHLTSSYFAKRDPSGVRLNAQLALKFANEVQLGSVARVRGKISGFRGTIQITVSDVVLERDPNAEVLHWLDCIKLARSCYNSKSPKTDT